MIRVKRKMPLLTAQELADELRVTVDTIWRYTRKGRIPGIRIGPRDYRYQLADVLAALAGLSASPLPAAIEKPRPAFMPSDPAKIRTFIGGISVGRK